MREIKFYSWAKEYFEFSNFSLHPITVDGKIYPTNEHYFQSEKFLPDELIEMSVQSNGYSIPYKEYIRMCKSPKEAKKLGLSRDYRIVEDWDNKRLDVMRTAIRAKFTQHEDLKDLLLSTGDSILKEDSPYDVFWGIGKSGKGKNMLGKLLMELRSELKNK